jgi:hypothetical protein
MDPTETRKSMAVFVGLIVVFLILKWLWNSSFMYETDSDGMRIFKIVGLLMLVVWILVH